MTASDFFVPSNKTIVNIIRGREFTQVFTDAHGYSTGLMVKFFIPQWSGMQQLNNKIAKIYAVSAVRFDIQLDSTLFDPFIIHSPPRSAWKFIPQVIPIGDSGVGFEDSSLNNNNIIPEIYPPAPYAAHP